MADWDVSQFLSTEISVMLGLQMRLHLTLIISAFSLNEIAVDGIFLVNSSVDYRTAFVSFTLSCLRNKTKFCLLREGQQQFRICFKCNDGSRNWEVKYNCI